MREFTSQGLGCRKHFGAVPAMPLSVSQGVFRNLLGLFQRVFAFNAPSAGYSVDYYL